jgi:hypothetical protein
VSANAHLKPELLAPEHDLTGFDCGEPDINRFIHEDARTHAAAGFSRTWVIAQPETRLVLGFVSIAAASQPIRARVNGKMKPLLKGILASCPYPAAPVLLIGQLGRRQELTKDGIGGRLLAHAIVMSLELSERVGISGIVLDALTDDLVKYYRKFRFERLPNPDKRVRRMLLTIADARATLAQSG